MRDEGAINIIFFVLIRMCHDFNLTKDPFKDDNGRYCRFTSLADTNGRNTRAHKRVQSRENTMEESSNVPCY